MSSRLARAAGAIAEHWKRSLIFTFLTLVVLMGLASTATQPADEFDTPGADSQTALDLFRDHSNEFAGVDATLVYTVDTGKITDAGPRGDVEAALAEVGKLDGVERVVSPFAEGGAVSPDGTLGAATVRYSKEWSDIDKKDGEALEEAAQPGDDVQVEMRGAPIDVASEQEFPVGELVGVALALVLLTMLFRSKAAMGATLLGALLGVMIGQLLLAILADPLSLPSFATTIAVMLGLGAGIDYSLLIIGRFREERGAGVDVREAAATAARTAGTSVVAAGLIVMVAIAGLLVVGIPAIGKMGVSAAIGVLAVVLSALFILPAMIGAFAKWLKPKRPEDVEPSPAFRAWGERVTRKPWVTIGAGVAVMLIFALPILDMRLGQPDDGNQPTSYTQRVAYDQLSEAFGAGSNGPLILAVDNVGDDPQAQQDLTQIAEAIQAEPGIAPQGVSPPQISEDGEIATIIATPTTSPQDQRTSDLLERLRGDVLPAATEGTPLRVYVGGQTAGFEDFSDKVAERLPLFIAVVIGLSVLLLMAAFRSVWIPLVSALFNLLSIAAAYGAVTAVFQKNIGAELIGADSGVPIVSFVPVLMFAILFGLSMDYNVFLLSRMQEAYHRGAGPREAVVEGMARIGKVVLFAGLIMGAVFLAFMSAPDVISKMFGIGLGLAILVDVVVVRLVIAPAVVTLLGDKAWWMPRWLDRILPNISLDPEHAQAEQRQPVAAG